MPDSPSVWPFAAQHFCSLENTSIFGIDGQVYKEGSSYHRAHGKGETTALRIPFGCAVYFIPADTKGFPKGKFEGSGEADVIAGYNMSPGYMWDGEYLCWSLKELADINMMAKASKHPPGLQGLHVTKKIRLPTGNVCHFPLKEKYDRQCRTIDGIGELQTVVQNEESVEKHLVCPDEHVDKEVPDITATNTAGSSGGAVLLPQPGVLNRLEFPLGSDTNSVVKVTCAGVMLLTACIGLMSMVKELSIVPPLALLTFIVTPGGRSSLLKIGFNGILTCVLARPPRRTTKKIALHLALILILSIARPPLRRSLCRKNIGKILFRKSDDLALLGCSVMRTSRTSTMSLIVKPVLLALLLPLLWSPERKTFPLGNALKNELKIEDSICAAARESPQMRDDEVPAMPCVANYKGEPHRPEIVPFNSHSWTVVHACVARPISRKELQQSPPAQASMKAEWDRLRNKMVWDEDKVREWSDVAREAQKSNYELNFGYLFGICVEKNSEPPPLHPKRKFKGRVVFQGNRVTNQSWEAAIFQDMGSCPATMEASKAADFYGPIPGHAVEIADAVQAYIQAELSGTPCWICLPPEARPASWPRFKKPVVPLLRALYGHPGSGTMWEVHCDKHVQSVCFTLVGEEWQSKSGSPAIFILL